MPAEHDEVKARILKETEEVVEAMLASKRPAGQNSLSDIERLAIRGRRAFEELVTQALVEEESAVEPQHSPTPYAVPGIS